MISVLISRLVILVLGTLYPAYASYKAIRTKDVEEYVRWMMYWVVFAFFTAAETVTDMFFSFWLPFYYEAKIIVVLWLLSPATEGSSILYRKFVHPVLVKREKEIDAYLDKAKTESYKTVMELGTRGVQYASRVIMQTAINGGGGLMNTLRKSYSLGDVSQDARPIRRRANVLPPVDESDRPSSRALPQPEQIDSDIEEFDDLADDFIVEDSVEEVIMRPPSQRAPSRAQVTREIYFTEIDNVRQGQYLPGEIRSVEDISSGYSSAEFLPVETVGTSDTVQRRTTGRSKVSRPVSTIDSGVASARTTRSSATSSTSDQSSAVKKSRPSKRRAPLPPVLGAGNCVRHIAALD